METSKININKLIDRYKNYRCIIDSVIPESICSDDIENRQLIKDVPNWNYIPSEIDDIEHLLKDLSKERRTKLSFLDIGCGMPLIPSIVSNMPCINRNKCRGIEYNKKLHEYIETTFWGRLFPVFFANAFEYDNYSDYDILFTNMPVKGESEMSELITYILNNIRKDAIFYACIYFEYILPVHLEKKIKVKKIFHLYKFTRIVRE